MRFALAVILAVLAFATGCTTHAILRDPTSGRTVNCTAMSQYQNRTPSQTVRRDSPGLTWAIQERKCINGYLASGFVCIQGSCGVRRVTMSPSGSPCRDKDNEPGVWDAQAGFCRVALVPSPPPPPLATPSLAQPEPGWDTGL